MILLEIGCHATVHKLIFDDLESADAALAELAPKIGLDYYGRNEAGATHIIKTPTGDVVVALNKIEVARVLDSEEWDNRTLPLEVASQERLIAHEVRKAIALAGIPK